MDWSTTGQMALERHGLCPYIVSIHGVASQMYGYSIISRYKNYKFGKYYEWICSNRLGGRRERPQKIWAMIERQVSVQLGDRQSWWSQWEIKYRVCVIFHTKVKTGIFTEQRLRMRNWEFVMAFNCSSVGVYIQPVSRLPLSWETSFGWVGDWSCWTRY